MSFLSLFSITFITETIEKEINIPGGPDKRAARFSGGPFFHCANQLAIAATGGAPMRSFVVLGLYLSVNS